MTSRVRAVTGALLATALLAAVPSFGIGRDLTAVRMASPTIASPTGVMATETGFFLRWDSDYVSVGTTTDATGAPRLPAKALPRSYGTLYKSGDGYLSLSQDGIAELDAGGTPRRTVLFDHGPLHFYSSAFNGTNFLLLDANGFEGCTARLVNRDGKILTKVILEAQMAAAAASPDGGFIAAGASMTDGVRVTRINSRLQVTEVTRVASYDSDGGGGSFAVQTNPSTGQTVIAWTASISFIVHTIAVLDTGFTSESILGYGSARTNRIALLPSGEGFVLLQNATEGFPQQQRLLARRLDARGAPLDAGAALLLNGAFSEAAATKDRLVLLGVPDGQFEAIVEVCAAITDRGIVPSATYDPALTAVRQTNPSVASDGIDFFGSWYEPTRTTESIVAGRLTRAGIPIDGTGLTVAEGTRSGTERLSPPAVAYGGGVYLVVYTKFGVAANAVFGRRFARDGTPIDPAPFMIGYHAEAPSVAFGGGHFLVAWRAALNGAGGLDGTLVGSEGPPESVRQLVPPGAGDALYGLAWNGRHFIGVYVWNNRLRVFRTAPNGRPLEEPATAMPAGIVFPAIACSDTECLVSALSASGPAAIVVHDDATLHAGEPKSVLTNPSLFQSISGAVIAFDGASYVLAWRAQRALLGTARITRAGDAYDVAASSAITDSPIVDPNYATYPAGFAIAANAAGDTAIFSAEFSLLWPAFRIRAYFASELPLPRHRAQRP